MEMINLGCGIPYIGETSRSINQRIQEHVANIKHNRSCSSALAEYAVKSNHHVCIEDSRVIAKIDHFHHRKLSEAIEIKKCAINLNKEAIEIEKFTNNLNRNDDWKLSRSWITTLFSYFFNKYNN